MLKKVWMGGDCVAVAVHWQVRGMHQGDLWRQLGRDGLPSLTPKSNDA